MPPLLAQFTFQAGHPQLFIGQAGAEDLMEGEADATPETPVMLEVSKEAAIITFYLEDYVPMKVTILNELPPFPNRQDVEFILHFEGTEMEIADIIFDESMTMNVTPGSYRFKVAVMVEEIHGYESFNTNIVIERI